MLFGHIGVGLAAKYLAPKASLWVLLASVELLDFLMTVFWIFDMEVVGTPPPWSHGLFMSAVWAGAIGIIAFLAYKDRRTGAVIGLLVFSHWILDYISWPVPLPLLFSSSPAVAGLELGSLVVFEAIVEFGLLAGGLAIYLNATKTSRRLFNDKIALGKQMPQIKRYLIISWGVLVGALVGLGLSMGIEALAASFIYLFIDGILCGIESSAWYRKAKKVAQNSPSLKAA